MSSRAPGSGREQTDDLVPSTPPARYAFVVISRAGLSTHLFPEQGAIVLGRAEGCDVRVDDASMSRRHAALHAGHPPTVEDLGSHNGTLVLGQRLAAGERRPLAVGNVIHVGGVTVVIQKATQDAGLAQSSASEPPKGVLVLDPRMEHIYRLIDAVAPGDLPVLILGETGVGKEVIAEALHSRSNRAAGPLVRLNCAALTESLLESELFGHERGAFTGAQQAKEGLLESGDKGTVFLDEVGELPLATQAKLLRVLENGEVLRVGSVRPRRVDIRFASATNRDLEAAVAAGRFRADLLFRLSGITLTVPPLRERPGEILAFADFFAIRSFRKRAVAPRPLSRDAAAALTSHAWPGNIRELRNVMERAALLCQGALIEASDLALESSPFSTSRWPAAPTASVPPPAPSAPLLSEVDDDLRKQMQSFERTRIVEALDRCGGNQSRAAKMLGLSRRALVTKIAAYDLPRPRKGR